MLHIYILNPLHRIGETGSRRGQFRERNVPRTFLFSPLCVCYQSWHGSGVFHDTCTGIRNSQGPFQVKSDHLFFLPLTPGRIPRPYRPECEGKLFSLKPIRSDPKGDGFFRNFKYGIGSVRFFTCTKSKIVNPLYNSLHFIERFTVYRLFVILPEILIQKD